jgi:hypothetical protein
MNIPIIIPCYNNYIYVKNTIEQLINTNKDTQNNIIILDNKSSDINTIKYLKSVENKVIYNKENKGPWITPDINNDIYNLLPDKFIVTDPDLEFNSNLPSNYIDILSNLSDKYNCNKIGFALDISDYDKMYNSICDRVKQTQFEWERQFWKNRINDNTYELYLAQIDTTFALINKMGNLNINIRIAGNFTAKHLPWYIDNKLLNIYDNYILNTIKTTNISTTSKRIKDYIESNYYKVIKNNTFFFINNNSSDLQFWKEIYLSWNYETFFIFDKLLDINKIFIDIGAWIGATTIYASRKSKHVYALESDIKYIDTLKHNCKNNCNNYTIIDNYKMDYNDIILEYKLTYDDISLINIDIKGNEENILNTLYELYNAYKVKIYITFYYPLWENKDIDRFTFLNNEQKNKIKNNIKIGLIFA